MSARDWIGDSAPWLIAFLGVILFALAYVGLSERRLYQAAYHNYVTAKAKNDARQEIDERCRILPTVKEALDCAKQAAEIAREPERSEEDLKAQQGMAEWAYGMLWITGFIGFASIGVTIIGIIYVRRTLEAALESNRVAREIGQAQVRAYLTVTGGTVEFLGDQYLPRVRIKIQNTGQTPAIDSTIAYDVRLNENPRMGGSVRVRHLPIGHDIGANTGLSKKIDMFDIGVDYNLTGRPETVYFEVSGTVSYRTVFNIVDPYDDIDWKSADFCLGFWCGDEKAELHKLHDMELQDPSVIFWIAVYHSKWLAARKSQLEQEKKKAENK